MDLKDYIESIPGFPKEGIVFRDVTPILQNANAMRYCVDQFNDFVKSIGADVVIGPEARGFLFGSLLYSSSVSADAAFGASSAGLGAALFLSCFP